MKKSLTVISWVAALGISLLGYAPLSYADAPLSSAYTSYESNCTSIHKCALVLNDSANNYCGAFAYKDESKPAGKSNLSSLTPDQCLAFCTATLNDPSLNTKAKKTCRYLGGVEMDDKREYDYSKDQDQDQWKLVEQ